VATTSATRRGAASSARPAESTDSRRPCLSSLATATQSTRTVIPASTKEEGQRRRRHASRAPVCPCTALRSWCEATRGKRSSVALARTWICEAGTGAPRLVLCRRDSHASSVEDYGRRHWRSMGTPQSPCPSAARAQRRAGPGRGAAGPAHRGSHRPRRRDPADSYRVGLASGTRAHTPASHATQHALNRGLARLGTPCSRHVRVAQNDCQLLT
jgi:hypothetical protein